MTNFTTRTCLIGMHSRLFVFNLSKNLVNPTKHTEEIRKKSAYSEKLSNKFPFLGFICEPKFAHYSFSVSQLLRESTVSYFRTMMQMNEPVFFGYTTKSEQLTSFKMLQTIENYLSSYAIGFV